MEPDEQRVAMNAIIARLARRYRHGPDFGKTVRCRPSKAEKLGHVKMYFEREKVIYDTWDLAEQAAREMEEIGAMPQRPYFCKRSKHNHCHLTLDKSPGTRARYQGRIEH